MRNARFPIALAVAVLTVAACGDQAGLTAPDSDPAFSAQGAEQIPISFVVQFASFDGAVSRPHGQSGRSQTHLCLSFSVQEGDLEGDLSTCFSANDPSDQTASHGPAGWFATTVPDFSEYDVCMPATGWCGTFSASATAGKVYPQPRGVEFVNSVAHGGGDFAGMKLQGTVYECADSQGDRGCFNGYLLVPASQ